MRFLNLVSALSLVALSLTGCGEDKTTNTAANTENAQSQYLRVGVSPGPFGLMIEKAIAPSLEAQGYKVQVIEFTDYVQPNLALESGDLDANLMQHTAYLNNLVATQGVKIEAVTTVPTLGMGVFSNKVKALPETAGFDDAQKAALQGGMVGLPNDAVNLARALRLCSKLHLIVLNPSIVDENKISTADIIDNPWGLEFVPMEAAQLSRSLDSLVLAFIPGNYAYAAKLDYSTALGVEEVAEDIKNVVAVHQGEQKLHDLFFNVVRSPEFKQRINDNHTFDQFSRPQWWNEVGAAQAASTESSPAASQSAPAAGQSAAQAKSEADSSAEPAAAQSEADAA